MLRYSCQGAEGPLVVSLAGWAAGYRDFALVARVARVYAAAHVAAVRFRLRGEVVDWEANVFGEPRGRVRRGQAMDTAQRGMGLSWDLARQSIARSASSRAGPWPAGRAPTS